MEATVLLHATTLAWTFDELQTVAWLVYQWAIQAEISRRIIADGQSNLEGRRSRASSSAAARSGQSFVMQIFRHATNWRELRMSLQTGKHGTADCAPKVSSRVAASERHRAAKSTPGRARSRAAAVIEPRGGAAEGIRIFLLREPRVERAQQNGAASVPLPHVLRLLLGALVIHRSGSLQRSTLAGMMWPDCAEVRVRACLNTAIWRLRCILEPRGVQRGTYLIVCPSGEVCFNAASPHWIDIHALERRALDLIDCPVERIDFDDAECFLDFLRTHASEFLDGQGDEWVLRAREHLRRLCLDALDRLLHSFDHRGAVERGLDLALHILEFDPLREDVHRHVMRMYAASGQRALAMKQFEKCRELLFRELSVVPMPDTVALYRSIANSSAMPSADAPSIPDVRAALHGVQAELRDALQHLHAGLALLARVEEGAQRRCGESTVIPA